MGSRKNRNLKPSARGTTCSVIDACTRRAGTQRSGAPELMSAVWRAFARSAALFLAGIFMLQASLFYEAGYTHAEDTGAVWQQEQQAGEQEQQVGEQQQQVGEQEQIQEQQQDGDQEQERVYATLSSGTRLAKETDYVTPEAPTVYLTFDDGPSKHTEPVLDILKEEGVPATFFVLGQLVSGRKNLISRMQAEGHAVGNHSYNHAYKELYKSFASFWGQVVQTDRVLEEVLGHKPTLLRAPGGTYTNFDSFYYYHLEQAGFTIMDWNVDSRDAVRQGVKAEEILGEIQKSPLKHELIVLLHDGAGHEETVKALPGIIAYYKELGYSFAVLDETVKPIQFPLTKSKWNRTYSQQQFAAADQETRHSGELRYGDREAALRLAAQVHTASQEAEAALYEAQAEPPLRILTNFKTVNMGEAPQLFDSPAASKDTDRRLSSGGANEWSLEPGQYSFSHSRFSVPVRRLAEELGGAVDWNGERRLATIRTGGLLVEIDPARRTVTEQRLGKPPKTHYLADVTWEDGEIRIGLRAGAWLLGGRVSGYAIDKSERIVSLDVQTERQSMYLFQPLAAWKKRESLSFHV